MKRTEFALFLFWILCTSLLALGCADELLSGLDGDGLQSCESDADCGENEFCTNGYCLAFNGDIDADGDGEGNIPNDGDERIPPDGDNPLPVGCEDLDGVCVDAETCPRDMRFSYVPYDCGADTPYCCLPDLETACGQQGGYCEHPASQGCSMGFDISPQDLGCAYYGGFCCLAPGECMPEGEIINAGDVCCPGLIETAPIFLEDEGWGDCLPLPCGDCAVCTRCGNGVCGLGESYCNCEMDCPVPAEYCLQDEDCGRSFCFEKEAGGCTQAIPYCRGDQCDLWSEDYLNSLCIGDTCQPLECSPGETAMFRCWDDSQVTACVCSPAGEWDCVDNPQAICPPEPECGIGQLINFTCPDGAYVPWCECVNPSDPSWECIRTPENQCEPAENLCEEIGGFCAEENRECPPDTKPTDDLNGCPPWSNCCLPGDPENLCVLDGGECHEADEGCPIGGYGVDLPCSEPDQICCKGGMPDCAEAGGLCWSFENDNCPEGYWPASGVWYECSGENFCCFPEDERSCERAGGLCIGWSPVCPPGTETYPPVGCPDDMGACCLPDDNMETACQREGGYCAYFDEWCDEGYTPISNPAGCEGPRGLCCLPEDEPYCNSDDDCGRRECHEESGPGGWSFCLETYPYCGEDGTCKYKEQTYENAYCLGLECVPMECWPGEEIWFTCPNGEQVFWCRCNADGVPDCVVDDPELLCEDVYPECYELDGYCTRPQNGCEPGYMGLDDPAGCERPRNLCCTPTGPMCSSDWDCGESECYPADDMNGCIQEKPYCENGVCRYYSEYYENALCVDGTCEKADCWPGEEWWHQCENGESILWCVCTPEGWMECFADDPDWLCEETQDCNSMGGECVFFFLECDPGYYSAPEFACDFPLDLMTCCLPAEDRCREDWQCGEPECFSDQGMAECWELYPFCEGGQCMYEEAVYEQASCVNGRCQPSDFCEPGEEIWHRCEDGTAHLWCFCDDTGNLHCETDDPDQLCNSTERECQDYNGYCTSWNYGCVPGYSMIDAGCGDMSCAGGCICCAPWDGNEP